MLENIRIVLMATSHPGNIGATARAMKTMGLSRLYLVQPKSFPHPEATAMSAGAEDILAKAVVVPDFITAIADCQLVIGLSARQRSISLPMVDARTGAQQALKVNGECALIFGRENNGLNNEELGYCHYQVQIPTGASYKSLNLAAAVQILCYEIQMAIRENPIVEDLRDDLANSAEVYGFYQHLEETLIEIGFLKPAQPKFLMQHLHNLYQRTQLSTTEINLLRGMLTAIQNKRHR